MSNFVNDIIKNANDQIKYSNTLTAGEITVDNGDGTYAVKIANASSAIPTVETLNYDAAFSVGEIVTIGFENGCKESPKIMGHSKKIKQDPVEVEVDYSGEEGGGGEEVESTLICTSASGTIAGTDNGSDYNKCHDSVDGADLNDITIYTDSIYVYQQYPGAPIYEIDRGFIYFDTSAIPVGATITSAILSLYCVHKAAITTDYNIVIQDGQPTYPSPVLINSNYYYANYKNNGGQKLASAFTLNAYNNIPLTSNGIAWVNKGGITKFCLRSSQDIAKTAPTNDTSFIGCVASEAYMGSSDYAKLIITYTI